MKCSINGCPGKYEEQEINHTVRHRGEIFVIDQVPAEVCTVCGDVLLKPGVVRHMEELLQTEAKPSRMVPLLDFVSA